MNDCVACSTGDCLICQFRAPVEVGLTSRMSRLAEPDGDGNKQVRPRGACPEGVKGGFASRMTTAGFGGPALAWCPLCGVQLPPSALIQHVSQKHPGIRVSLPLKSRGKK